MADKKRRTAEEMEFPPRLVFVRQCKPKPHVYFVDLSDVIGDLHLKMPDCTENCGALSEVEFEKQLLDKNPYLQDIVGEAWAVAMEDKKDGEHLRECRDRYNEPYNEHPLSDEYEDDTLQKLLQLCFKTDQEVLGKGGSMKLESIWHIVD